MASACDVHYMPKGLLKICRTLHQLKKHIAATDADSNQAAGELLWILQQNASFHLARGVPKLCTCSGEHFIAAALQVNLSLRPPTVFDLSNPEFCCNVIVSVAQQKGVWCGPPHEHISADIVTAFSPQLLLPTRQPWPATALHRVCGSVCRASSECLKSRFMIPALCVCVCVCVCVRQRDREIYKI
jgi:hypothetical protein